MKKHELIQKIIISAGAVYLAALLIYGIMIYLGGG
jgi:hypothetical protein